MILPARLKKGDTIGIVSPASSPDEKLFKRGVDQLKKLNLQVKLGSHTMKKNNYLAGSDEERINDLHDMLRDDEVKAIIFSRGGYGTARLAPYLDFDLIKENPKIIWGYSDITFLHTAIRQATGLVTFHGPMIVSLGKDTVAKQTIDTFKQLFSSRQITYDESLSPLTVLSHGETQGQLVGGNLSLLVSSLKTAYEIDLHEKILLIEDVEEPLYKIDLMLNQLTQSKLLQTVKGIAIGDFKLCHHEEDKKDDLIRLFQHYFTDLNIPIIEGFKIGHCEPNIALPLGVKAHLSTKEKTLIVEKGLK